jgi:hypothetical protein
MATWKKVVVSGSAVSQLDNDANYASATGQGILSSSAQIATNISGAFTATSGGFSTRITTNTTNIGTNTSNIGTLTSQTSSYALKADISGAFTSTSSSLAGRITTNTTNIGALTSQTSSYALKTQVSGAFTLVSSSIAVDIAALEAAVGAGGTLISASAEGDAQGQIKFNGVNVDARDLGTGDSPTFTNLTLTGNLAVNGTVTTINTENLNIADKFILLNSGSGDSDAGIVINGAGSAIGWDSSEGRFALDYAGATFNQATITSDAFVASVVTIDDANYQKVGNIRIDTASQDIFIYS